MEIYLFQEEQISLVPCVTETSRQNQLPCLFPDPHGSSSAENSYQRHYYFLTYTRPYKNDSKVDKQCQVFGQNWFLWRLEENNTASLSLEIWGYVLYTVDHTLFAIWGILKEVRVTHLGGQDKSRCLFAGNTILFLLHTSYNIHNLRILGWPYISIYSCQCFCPQPFFKIQGFLVISCPLTGSIIR